MQLLSVIAIVLSWSMSVYGHGRMIEPPSRSSAWRFGFPTPHNYDDTALYCGGFSRKQSNGGKCGVCGDPWDGVRLNEAGGRYATGTIVRKYTMGQTITLKSDITANHYGWMEYRICPNNDVTKVVTKECLDNNLLQMADGSGSRYVLPSKQTGVYSIQVRLPANMVCSQCVIQWKYHAGNSWGVDPDTGRGCIGCGPQEEFFGCADVSIRGRGPVTSSPTQAPTQAPTHAPTTHVRITTTTQKASTHAQTATLPNGFHPVGNNGGQATTKPPGGCVAINTWAGNPTFDQWCTDTCATGLCPTMVCDCSGVATSKTTKATTTTTPTTTTRPTTKATAGPMKCHVLNLWSGDPTMDQWCTTVCASGNCPTNVCECDGMQTLPQTTTSQPNTQIHCHGVNDWAGDAYLDRFCLNSCTRGDCPARYCKCTKVGDPLLLVTSPPPTTPSTTTPPTTVPIKTTSTPTQRTCTPIGQFAGNTFYEKWCVEQCHNGNCPQNICVCKETAGPVGSGPSSTSSILNPFLATSYTHCVSNGRESGDYWNVWCQNSCDGGSCPIHYCNCS